MSSELDELKFLMKFCIACVCFWTKKSVFSNGGNTKRSLDNSVHSLKQMENEKHGSLLRVPVSKQWQPLSSILQML
jgi:hypothetical protein